MSGDPRHALGRDAERIALRWLQGRGLALMHANWRGRLGELDLVMRDGPVLAIIEVRCRPGRPHADALASVGAGKAGRLGTTIREFVSVTGIGDTMPLRVDVVTVAGPAPRPTVRWWRDAVRIGRLY